MSSAQLQRGAVSVVFLIFVIILMLAFATLWFTQLQENGDLQKVAAGSKAQIEERDIELDFARGCYAELAKVIGDKVPANLPEPGKWGVRGAVYPTDKTVLGDPIDSIKQKMKEAATQCEDTETPTVLANAINSLANRYKVIKNQTGELDQTVKGKDAEIAGLRKQVEDRDAEMAKKVQELNTEKENATARLSQQLNESNTQRDEAQSKNRELTDEVGKTKETSNKEVTQAKSQMKTLEGQVNSYKANLRTQRDTEKPDGKVLAVNRGLQTLWIDIGGKQRLRRGTTFKVYETVKGGEKALKGRIVVTSVEFERSECKIESETGAAGITEGDWITNPFFDPARQTHFVILGELSGSYTKEVAKRMLDSFGAKVDDKVTVETDFLVLGIKETPDAPDLMESPEYKQAVAWGIEVIRSRDLAAYLSN